MARTTNDGHRAGGLMKKQGEHIASCELRDDTAVGAGFELVVRHDDEPIVGRRCLTESEARYYANAFRQDYVRNGWTEN